MGTLAATLTLSDSTTFSDAINFSVTDSLTTTAPAQGLETLIQLTLLYFKQKLVNNMLD